MSAIDFHRKLQALPLPALIEEMQKVGAIIVAAEAAGDITALRKWVRKYAALKKTFEEQR
jgi:16S rRNA G1207 methylase RsmC